ncbi:MAG: tetratricopeptide repeat protein [Holosporaceae bacterium]|jgi:Flp pilus assembly protein TadD|nr:tetratricopeptide repeat protein [Holosporaceae bacterium]
MRNVSVVLFLSILLGGCSLIDEGLFTSESMVRIAKKARQSGNTEAAINFYKKALEVNSDSTDALLGLAEAYIDTKLLDAALEYIKKAEKRGCNISRSSYLRGKVYLLFGDNIKAEKEFSKNDSADSMNALGAVYDGRGLHEKAQALYKQVIAKNPSYIDAYNNMGLSLMLCDKYKEAIFYLENACSLPESNVLYRSNLALAYGLYGDVAKAKAMYAQDFDGNALEEKISYLEDVISTKRQQTK